LKRFHATSPFLITSVDASSVWNLLWTFSFF